MKIIPKYRLNLFTALLNRRFFALMDRYLLGYFSWLHPL
ncbi:uncharacterized protein MP3633_2729 [Marinomonas primoryensis]|uniref:Uncharacterized protein n=1 Tax=Marinomonas primoryensis TaxID=178399 RepID=A0A859CXR1_9GAMM|nr:uncharacterized protein MP3633_2729 [Marinomonas primoryensis]